MSDNPNVAREMQSIRDLAREMRAELPDTITLKRIYSTHCQVCGEYFGSGFRIVYFVPLDNNIACLKCAVESCLKFEPRIYKEGE